MITATTSRGRLLEVKARGESAEERGVFVLCPGSKRYHDIGECLRCSDYQGMWFTKPGSCSLRCSRAAPAA